MGPFRVMNFIIHNIVPKEADFGTYILGSYFIFLFLELIQRDHKTSTLQNVESFTQNYDVRTVSLFLMIPIISCKEYDVKESSRT